MKMKRTKRESEEEEDEEEDCDLDQDVLDRILNKLYDFDGPGDKRSKKKQKKRKRLKQEEEDVTAEEENVILFDCGKDDLNVSHVTNAAGDDRTSASTSGDSGGLEQKTLDVEIVTFQDPWKKKKSKQAAEAETKPAEGKEKKKKEPDVLSMEKARLDVHRFGITGFQKQQQRVFEQDRAIMLGARPPKKNYVNYKEFQQMIKEKKSREKQEEAKADTQKKKKKSSGKQKNVKRQPGSSAAEPTGHVGRFKNGMLLLSSKDIQKLNSKVRK
ncbi:uncharacterized protein C1orf131 homolog isoform X2 [Hemibagrus wyckioides]|uniref:uncharacterized protein C1orf131 homolog isoform X2 n=1 Tax=Hemibagrus wyckioides TaxID=337641 RepID=UPI00266CEE2F|nr:uncharacterized protein C1orf131 homolog isoform X2 [Hemibagrus wyckioides]